MEPQPTPARSDAAPPRGRGRRLLRRTAAGALLAAALVGLAWFDVLPGGWTLRGWVEPHHLREARRQRERSGARLARFATQNPAVPEGAIVFLGSSTVERFPLAERFPCIDTANRGIGNESSGELLLRLDASLPPTRPAGFVLYLASIDFRRDGVAPLELARRVERVLDALAAAYPEAPWILLGLLSERDADEAFVERLRTANAALERLAAERGGAFLDTAREPLIDARGRLAERFSADRLHLNDAGYRILAGWLAESAGPLGEVLDCAR